MSKANAKREMRQCPSCGGFCKRSGCERANVVPKDALDAEPVTVLPDGSAFAVMSFSLPKDHWLYAERQYRNGEYEPIELGKPILTHEMRDAVVSAVRYAVRGATNCGKEVDFDPDALVQNAVYALCGSYGTLKPKQEQSHAPAVDAEIGKQTGG